MQYAFQIIDVFSSTPFGGNQLAVLPDAAGISTEGMQKIAREFNFGETTFILPKNDPANTCEGASSHLGWSSTLQDIPRSAQPVPL